MGKIEAIRTAGWEREFFKRLRQEADSYFHEEGISKTGDHRLYTKTIILGVSLLLHYIWLVFFTPDPIWWALIPCATLGLNFAVIGFNVMHDGAHGSYSKKSWVNNIMASSLELMGGSSYLWKQKHNVNHHMMPNVEGVDDDIDVKPFMRLHTGQPKKWLHRFQHIYSVLLYGLTYLFWITLNDFKKYFSGKVAEDTPIEKMAFKDHFKFWASKVFYFGLFLVVPIFKVGLVPTLIGYGVASFVCGWFISIVFQLAHVVEDTGWEEKANEKEIMGRWAVHQIETTANFATHNRVLSWFLGGLNYQIEHHLFPKISHVHYPAISKRLQAVCAEFNVPYREFKTTRKAIVAHFRHLKAIGMAA